MATSPESQNYGNDFCEKHFDIMDNIKATMITTYHLDRVLSGLVADQDGYLRYSHRLEKGHMQA